MYFLPRSSKFNAWVVTVKPLHLYLLTAIILSATVGVWLFGVYFRLNAMIVQQQVQIKQHQEQALNVTQIRNSHELLASSVQEMHKTISEYSVHNETQELQASMIFLINQATNSGLAMLSCSCDRSVDKEWYVENGVSVDVSGSYEQLLNFLNACYDSEHLIGVKQLTMNRSSQDAFSLKAHLNLMVIK